MFVMPDTAKLAHIATPVNILSSTNSAAASSHSDRHTASAKSQLCRNLRRAPTPEQQTVPPATPFRPLHAFCELATPALALLLCELSTTPTMLRRGTAEGQRPNPSTTKADQRCGTCACKPRAKPRWRRAGAGARMRLSRNPHVPLSRPPTCPWSREVGAPGEPAAV